MKSRHVFMPNQLGHTEAARRLSAEGFPLESGGDRDMQIV